MTTNIEHTIVTNLLRNEEFARKAIPFIKEHYFADMNNRVLFHEVSSFIEQYKKLPTANALHVHIESRTDLGDEQYNEIQQTVTQIAESETVDDTKWLIDQTEQWCQERAVFNAIMDSIQIIDGKDKNRTKLAIPELLNDALSVSFDTSIGHDYFRDAAKRYDFYQRPETKIPYDIELLNEITNGGVTKQTLNLFMATTGGGKSIVLCHLAASFVAQGKNVLYVTLEMSEEEISRRIDANLMNIDSNRVAEMQRKDFLGNIKSMYKQYHGELIVKMFPGGGATHAGHIRYLIKELQMKKRMDIDVLIVDYLSIAGSSRYKAGGVNPSYYIKSVAEEIRGLGQEFDIPVFSAAQYNREGMSSTDAELTDIAESIGITHTADLVLGLIRTEELDNLGQLYVKQLKNRYGNINHYRRFVVGVDLAKSKWYNLTEEAQTNVQGGEDDTPVADRGKFSAFHTPANKKSKKDFSGFKV